MCSRSNTASHPAATTSIITTRTWRSYCIYTVPVGRSLYFALLVATGCDVVFRLDDVDPPMSTIDASVAFDVCAAQPTDRSARYAFVTSSTAFIQATALYACAIRGMQLVSINDADELAALDGEIQQKLAMGSIYIGMNDVDNEGTWVGADGCPAYEAWGPA